MKNNNLLSILILIVIGFAAYMIVQTVRDSARQATAPFQQVNEANHALQTQMANLLNPTPTIIPDPVTYIHEIRALARLETIQYSVEKVGSPAKPATERLPRCSAIKSSSSGMALSSQGSTWKNSPPKTCATKTAC